VVSEYARCSACDHGRPPGPDLRRAGTSAPSSRTRSAGAAADPPTSATSAPGDRDAGAQGRAAGRAPARHARARRVVRGRDPAARRARRARRAQRRAQRPVITSVAGAAIGGSIRRARSTRRRGHAAATDSPTPAPPHDKGSLIWRHLASCSRVPARQAFFTVAEVALSACDRHRLRTAQRGRPARPARGAPARGAQVTLATSLVGGTLATLMAVLVSRSSSTVRRLAAVVAADRRRRCWCSPPRAQGARPATRRADRRLATRCAWRRRASPDRRRFGLRRAAHPDTAAIATTRSSPATSSRCDRERAETTSRR